MNKTELIAAVAEKAEISKKDSEKGRNFEKRLRKSAEGFY